MNIREENTSSRIGVGTYRIRGNPGDVLEAALRSRCSLFDCAANYRGGLAHADVRRAVVKAVDDGVLYDPRDVMVTTKVGYALPDSARLVGRHSFDREFLRLEVIRVVAELAPLRVSCLYLHNPEEQVGPRFEQRLMGAMEVLERAREDGKIDSFGIASWDGFESAHSRPPAVTVARLDDLATDVGGVDHGLRSVQMPVSLVRSRVASQALDGQGPISDALKRGWCVFGSSPLHGGELPRIISEDFMSFFPTAATPAQAALLFALSVPGVTAVLTSPSTPRQFEDSFGIMAASPLTESEIRQIINLIN